MLTTKTSGLLGQMAMRLLSVSEAVYNEGWRAEADEIALAAHKLSCSARAIEARIEAGAAVMLADPLADCTPTKDSNNG